MEYTVWRDLGEKLQTEDYVKYYFTSEKYKAENPLENLVVLPGISQFFGPRVLNLFIVSKPYGWKKQAGEWVEDWPPEGLTEAIERHKLSFDAFTSYRTVMFIDFNFVNKLLERSPLSKIGDMMSATFDRLNAVCEELADYGFEMGPRIDNEVGPEFFAPYLDPHYQD
jgi:hypothetical protein